MQSPAEIHKVYNNNVEQFYKAAGSFLSAETDDFFRRSIIGLWSKSGGMKQTHLDIINEIYSKSQPKPNMLYWELTGAVCDYSVFSIPEFFTAVASADRLKKTTASRVFIRVFANILLSIATADEDVSASEASFIASCTNALKSVCDKSGVPQAKEPLDAMEYVTSPEPSFLDSVKKDLKNEKAAEQNAAEQKMEEQPSLEELMKQLDALTGLDKIKADVKSLANLIKVRKLRAENGLPVAPISLHMVFMGNPGTGKTTVARLLSGIYRATGVLSKGQLVEADRSTLVAGYVGQTALKTAEAVEKAKGGILFIDEAYSLTPEGSGNDYGREAIEIILKSMEDNRADLVVIVAGYSGLMEKFISSNPGLESRFSKYFVFEDYNGEQLYEIFLSMCRKNEYIPTEDTITKAKSLFKTLYENRDENFGNARDVRNIFEHAVSRQSDRLAAMDAPDKAALQALLPEDLEEI